jgi:cellulose synthase/poly-beta-1,6-N-acetylglucosamine synthase-like glycosyltransferase
LCFSKPLIALQILIAVLFVAVGVQVIYLIVFASALSRKRTEKSNEAVPVSIVVCAHDEEGNLHELIPQLLSQDYPRFEIIIVNDRSNDGTYDFLLKETKADPRLRMVNIDHLPAHVNGKKYGLTLGIRAATYEWILFTDADCRPSGNNWIRSMSSHFDDDAQFVLGYSPYQKSKGFLNLFIRFESVLTAIQYFSFALLKNPYMGVGRNMAYRKSLFLEKKGFNQFLNVTGGDDDLFVNQHAKSATTRVEFKPEAQMLSIPKATWKTFFLQKIRHLSVGKRYQLKHRILLGIFTLTWIITWFTGLTLMIMDVRFWLIPVTLIVRILVVMIVVKTFVKQTRQLFEWWAIPILDFLYSIYYISTGLAALLTKKIRWKN